MNEQLNRAVTALREEGMVANPVDGPTVYVSAGDTGQQYILTNIQLLELLDNDQLTWRGIKGLHRELGGK